MTVDVQEAVAQAARVLARSGLVTAFGHVSARTADGFVITPAADLARAAPDRLIIVARDAAALPNGAPAEAWAHLAVYRERPDVAAIARAQPPAAFAAAAPGKTLFPLYGQASWLGASVPVHDDARLLRTLALAERAAGVLTEGEALLLRGNGGITTGDSPGLAVARMWLLEQACRAWIALTPAERRGLSPAEIASWRAVSAELLPRLWRHLAEVG
ncbi:class II aldolase/adducin family protein [Actinoplanes sp. NPDC051633]|uniref:class II aldolase/adducin family protein n=1 Tax=Actinoplanes sp. NPDC051633 TaxID=3155670 RepID=UPI00342E74EB